MLLDTTLGEKRAPSVARLNCFKVSIPKWVTSPRFAKVARVATPSFRRKSETPRERSPSFALPPRDRSPSFRLPARSPSLKPGSSAMPSTVQDAQSLRAVSSPPRSDRARGAADLRLHLLWHRHERVARSVCVCCRLQSHRHPHCRSSGANRRVRSAQAAGRAAAEFGVLRAADGRRAADAPEAEYEVLVGRQESRLGTVRHGDHESADSRSRSVMIETPSPFREGSFE